MRESRKTATSAATSRSTSASYLIRSKHRRIAVPGVVAAAKGKEAAMGPGADRQTSPGKATRSSVVGKAISVGVPAPASSPLYQPKVVQLGVLKKEYLKPAQGSAALPPDVFDVDRPAAALVYEPDVMTGKVPAIVFGHGFSQPPESYTSILEMFRTAGFLVIAPKTGLGDIFFEHIEGLGSDNKLPAKMQGALILDLLRSCQYLRETPFYKSAIGDIAFFGHSMGAASALIAASKVKESDVKTVVVLAPAVAQMVKTLTNDDLWLDGSPASVAAATQFFQNEFPANTPLTLVRASNDRIVPPSEVEGLFTIASNARKGEPTVMYTVDGNHLGFEDRIAIEVSAMNLLLWPLLWIANIIQYNTEIFSFIIGNSDKQRTETAKMLTEAFRFAFNDRGATPVPVSGAWDVEILPNNAAESIFQASRLADPDTDFNLKSEALLVSYAIAQAAIAATAGQLMLQQVATGHYDETFIGLTSLVIVSSALVYDNSVLAAGRFLGVGEPLRTLSKYRFLAASGAPLALVTGLNVAGRAGVAWAANPWCEGIAGLGILSLIALASYDNKVMLEIGARWEAGILRYSYDKKKLDLSALIPVITTAVGIALLGVQMSFQHHELLPVAVGPIIGIALNAKPPKVLPKLLADNLSEVLLFGALIYGEVTVCAMGL